MRKKLEKIYMALIFILLYAPIVTLVVLSFNASKTRAKWGGFTLHWYRSLFANTEIMNALYTTLIIALLASAIATVLGTLACIGINSMSKKSRTVFMGITNIPMLNGEIVMGISLMLLFIICRIQLGFGTILMAHITFNVPYVILSVMPKLKQTNKSTYEAALDLGASPLCAFWKVIFPDIMPGVVRAFCSPLRCPSMISLSPTSPRDRALIRSPQRFMPKSARESSRRCTRSPRFFLSPYCFCCSL